MGGLFVVVILAVGGYAFATLGSDGESDSNQAKVLDPAGEGDSKTDREPVDAGKSGGESTEVVRPEPEEPPSAGGPSPPPAGTGDPVEASGDVDGYIAQLGSFTELGGAEARLEKLQARGAADGILWSSDYPEMTPGYWVVYSGPFDSKTLADQAVEASGISDAFSREISSG